MRHLNILFSSLFLLISIQLACKGITEPEETDVTMEEPDELPSEPRSPDVALGKMAFVKDCAPCHASHDGFDLAYFDFSGHDIVRRAVAHVDSLTALDILAYVNTLAVTAIDRDSRPFQPTGAVLSNDLEFAMTVFGEDKWPSNMTPEQLLSFDTANLTYAVAFPRWSEEESEFDWMPNQPLPVNLVADEDSVLHRLIEDYHLQPDLEALISIARTFDYLSAKPGAVCEEGPILHKTPRPCFEAQRWVASLSAMHFLKYGQPDEIPVEILDLWWDVGQTSVSLTFNDGQISNFERNLRRRLSISWLMLSWAYDPVRIGVNTAYLAEFFKHVNLKRHSAFTGFYWMVSDPYAEDAMRPYDLFLQAIIGLRLPDEWFFDATSWGYQALLGFLQQGIRPTQEESLELMNYFLESFQATIDEKRSELSQQQTTTLDSLQQELASHFTGS